MRVATQLRARAQRTAPTLLIVLAAAIVLIGKADQAMFEPLRTGIADMAAPVLDALSQPLGAATAAVERVRGMANIYQDNLRLAEENRKLLQWQQVALKLSAENEAMRGLLKVVPESGVAYVTARLIGNSSGLYVRTALVNAGADQGVARGQAAIAEGGLIGRLTEVGRRAARVLLITDLNSRIPVVIPASRTSAVLAGDNSDRPRLVFASEPKAIRIGDRIVTSGDGGVFPPGLPVGVVAALDPGGARIEPYAELSQLDYVLLVDYGLAGGLPEPAPSGSGRKRPGKASDADATGTH
ncbi:MAG: rod shape-determining protein MreC [Alphaproteobacteria bacterium]